VGVGEAGEDLLNVAQAGRQGDWGAAEFDAQGMAFDELHDHDEFAVVPEGGVEFGDVWVVKAGEQLNFAKKASDDVVGHGASGGENLHGLDSVRDGMANPIDLAHPSGSESACYLIVADLVSNVEGHGLKLYFTWYK
jgi:hypothetical protein